MSLKLYSNLILPYRPPTDIPGGFITPRRTVPHIRHAVAVLLAVGVVSGGAAAPAAAQSAGTDEVCSEGRITSVRLDRRSVFDPASTSIGALAWTYRALNLLHVRTAASFIRRELLFEEGDCFDDFLMTESERLLDDYGFLAYARITREDDGAGGHALVVETRDDWSTKVDVGVTYDNSAFNLEKIEVTEENFLGQGVFGEFTHRDRREVRTQAFGLATPRLFGRTDASISLGRDRPGDFFEEYVRYPFVGETGKYAIRQGYDRGTRYFSYTTDGAEPFTQVLVPSFRELIEFSGARRFGGEGRSVILGVTLARDVVRFPRSPDVIYADDFGDLQPYPGALPAPLQEDFTESAATRVSLHLGTRVVDHVVYEGLDGLRDRLQVGIGFDAGLTVGRGFSVLVPDDVPGLDDTFGLAYAGFNLPIGSSLIHARSGIEARRDNGDWQDVLLDVNLVTYLRNRHLQSHTLFVRGSYVGGWRTTLPFQLSLGGREGVRSLDEDLFPGGRMARLVVEDRILFPWPRPGSADLGVTLFADIGRVWPGDVPYGVDSGWQTAIGGGLRIGLPAGTRHVWRTDIAFPVGGPSREPIFRVTFELNLLAAGFFTQDLERSRRLNLGANSF